MVVIEEENGREKIPKSKPLSDQSTAKTVENSSNDGCGADNNTAGCVSDGYETASDTELNDDVVEGEKREPPEQDSDRNLREENESSAAAAAVGGEKKQKEQKLEPSEEQIDEKALEEANNAKLEGNTLFRDGLYEEALSKYEIALQAVPNVALYAEIRSMCHANRAACFSKLEKFEETVKECTKALELNPQYIKVLVRRGEAHEKLEHFEEAIADMTKILELDPSNDQARRNIIRLRPLADEKREKMKDEMIGKLKEMGNSILGRFGMSVDNFKAVKDPNTGSYSVSFQR